MLLGTTKINQQTLIGIFRPKTESSVHRRRCRSTHEYLQSNNELNTSQE
jgi:hypothetical protein